MYLCFIDESGVSHSDKRPFVLVGVGIAASSWTRYERRLQCIKEEFDLGSEEIHAAILSGEYEEQNEVAGFASLSHTKRSEECSKVQVQQRTKSGDKLRKSQCKRAPYLHLTLDERRLCLEEIGREFASWKDAFWTVQICEGGNYPYKESRYQVALATTLSSFVAYLSPQVKNKTSNSAKKEPPSALCFLIHDATDYTTVGRTITDLWNRVNNTIHFGPTPLFVDSKHTNLLQLADLCAHAARIYFDDKTSTLLEILRPRLESASHYPSRKGCKCMLCSIHRD